MGKASALFRLPEVASEGSVQGVDSSGPVPQTRAVLSPKHERSCPPDTSGRGRARAGEGGSRAGEGGSRVGEDGSRVGEDGPRVGGDGPRG